MESASVKPKTENWTKGKGSTGSVVPGLRHEPRGSAWNSPQGQGTGHRAPGTSAYPLAQVQLPQPAESFGEQLLDASPTFHSPGHKAGCWAGIQAVPVGLGADLESRKVRLGRQPGAEWAQPAAGVGPRGQGEVGMRWRVAVQSAEAGMWGKSLFPLSLGVTFCLLVAPGELCFLICERQAVTKPTEWDFREY